MGKGGQGGPAYAVQDMFAFIDRPAVPPQGPPSTPQWGGRINALFTQRPTELSKQVAPLPMQVEKAPVETKNSFQDLDINEISESNIPVADSAVSRIRQPVSERAHGVRGDLIEPARVDLVNRSWFLIVDVVGDDIAFLAFQVTTDQTSDFRVGRHVQRSFVLSILTHEKVRSLQEYQIRYLEVASTRSDM